MNGAIYLLIAIVGEVIATSFLRASAGFTQLVPSSAYPIRPQLTTLVYQAVID